MTYKISGPLNNIECKYFYFTAFKMLHLKSYVLKAMIKRSIIIDGTLYEK